MLIIDGTTVDRVATWPGIIAALRAGHRKPKPQIGDLYFAENGDGLLARGAWITGLGSCIKAATIFPRNVERTPYMASIQGSVLLFDAQTGAMRAVIDGAAVTRFKTAGDSALGAELLSRKDSRSLLMVGAGTMSRDYTTIPSHLDTHFVGWNGGISLGASSGESVFQKVLNAGF